MSTSPPRAVAAVLERVARADSKYLREHRDADSYTRAYEPGECWPAVASLPFTHVRVCRLEGGGRLRIFLCGEEGAEP